VLRDWNLEAKINDSDTWEVLREHKSDGVYADDGQGGFGLHVFAVTKKSTEPKFYRFFRISRTDSTSNIYCHRFELYGKLKKPSGKDSKKSSSSSSSSKMPTSGSHKFSCHAHDLTWQIPYGHSGWNCDMCRSSHVSTDFGWHCSTCNYDLCTTCVPTYYK